MTRPEDVTESKRQRQWTSPEHWTLSFKCWCDVLEHCISLPAYRALKKKNRCAQLTYCDLMVGLVHRFVSLYDVSEHFVVPWSKGTGCGLSTLMSPDGGQGAQLMLSHVICTAM